MSSKQEAVYTLNLTMNASGVAVSRLTAAELEERSDRIGSMVQRMMSESHPVASELFDSLVLDKTTDDGYLRLSYLRLWQAVEDAKRHLGQPELLNEREVIAGSLAPIELKAYRECHCPLAHGQNRPFVPQRFAVHDHGATAQEIWR